MLAGGLGRSVASRIGWRVAQRSYMSTMPTAVLSSASASCKTMHAPSSFLTRSSTGITPCDVAKGPQLVPIAQTRTEELARQMMEGKTVPKVSEEGLVFEFSFTWILKQYQDLAIGFARNLFQTTRPLLILFVMGQILKGAFFAMGAPMFLSFYSIWMFEVFYGVGQCVISFIFVNLFYNNMSYMGTKFTGMYYGSMHFNVMYILGWIALAYCGAAIPSDLCMCIGQTCLIFMFAPGMLFVA